VHQKANVKEVMHLLPSVVITSDRVLEKSEV